MPDRTGTASPASTTGLRPMPAPTPRRTTAEYLALIGSKYIMQVLNRALNPGAKADYSLVFTALQGVGKDRVLEAMFAPYYREGIPSPRVSPADFARGIAGAIVAHGAEMSAWRKSDVEEQKAALTRCVDHGRPRLRLRGALLSAPHLPRLLAQRRRSLQDATGNRRYWPFDVIRNRVDVEGLRRDRDQILAEALHRLKGGEQHWPTPEEEERLIVPERQKYMPTAALEILAILQRFIVEEPLTTAAEPRGLRLEMAAPATTSEGALSRRLLRKMLRDVRGGQASGARPGVQKGHRVLHDMAPRERLAAGAEAAAGRTEGDVSGERPRGMEFTYAQSIRAWVYAGRRDD